MWAEPVKIDKGTVGKWRQRFVEHRLDGLHDAPRSGAPRTIEDAHRSSDRQDAGKRPQGSHPLVLARHGQGERALDLKRAADLARLWPAAAPAGDLQAVTDRGFVAKVRDVVGLSVVR
jgi:hypothetical protein